MPSPESSKPRFHTPDWAKHAIWYEVLVSRFRNGDPSNDPFPRVPWTWDWMKPFGAEANIDKRTGRSQFYRHIWHRRYGGDLAGLREKLPYLRDCGVTALYLMPVFCAESEHKYDTSDYRHIDDSYGVRGSAAALRHETDDPRTWQWSTSDRLFLDFVAEAHRQGFRVICDVSFNHVGRGHYAFRDVLEHGRASRYADWFDIVDWGPPIRWRAWDGENGSLPAFRQDANGPVPAVREHLFAVTRRWMDPNGDGDPADGIDGWRLDVANLVAMPFWREWRRLVKSINPDAYITGEIWDDARPWLSGDQFDAVMNYPFAKLMQRFFVNRRKAIPATEMASALSEMLAWYPREVNLAQQNLLDSHDTDRFASMMANPDLPFNEASRVHDKNPRYKLRPPTKEEYRRMRCALIVQFTFVGAPMIWYGDEVGMFGAGDPHCRKPMVWKDLEPYDDPAEHVREEMLAHYRRLAAIRNTIAALRIGDIRFLHADDDKNTLAYSRTLDDQRVLIAINNGEKDHAVPVNCGATEDTPLFDFLDADAAEIVAAREDPAARPTVRLRPGARPACVVRDGSVTITLAAKSGAVLVPAPS